MFSLILMIMANENHKFIGVSWYHTVIYSKLLNTWSPEPLSGL